MDYIVNDRTGEVHESDCPRIKVIHSKSPWNPAKAALTPGVYADKICMPAGLPLRTPAVDPDEAAARRGIRRCTDKVGIYLDMLLLGSAFVSHVGPDGTCVRCGHEFA